MNANRLIDALFDRNSSRSNNVSSDDITVIALDDVAVVMNEVHVDLKDRIKITGSIDDANYVYTTGHNGYDLHCTRVWLYSSKPLQEFSNFYGDSQNYPIVAVINEKLKEAGIEGPEELGVKLKAGILQKIGTNLDDTLLGALGLSKVAYPVDPQHPKPPVDLTASDKDKNQSSGVYLRQKKNPRDGSDEISFSENHMNIKEKANKVIERLLGEYNRPGNHQPISIVAVVIDGEVLPVGGGSNDGNDYIYTTGYNGSDSHTNQVIISSSRPLTPFDDFYGDPSQYPVIDEINAALQAIDFEGLDGFGAGSLAAYDRPS